MKSRLLLTGAAAVSLCLTSFAVGGSPSGAAQRPATTSEQWGINTYVTYNCEKASVFEGWATTQFSEIKALGANSVAIAFPLYTSSIYSNSVYGKDICNDQAYQTPPASIVGDLIGIAHHIGLKVLVRPLIDQVNLFAQNPNWWRGVLKPSNLKTWFKNYLTTLRPYLLVAQSDHAEHFALETELDSLLPLSNWTAEIALARLVYTGDLVWNYSWNWPEAAKVTRPNTTFAIDTYPALSGTTPKTTVSVLASKWTALLKAKAYKVPKISTTTIDEIGIPAQDGAYAFPFKTSLPLGKYKFDPTIQANWFSAACSFVKANKLQGIYFWGPWLSLRDGKLLTKPSSVNPQDLQPVAQTAIKKCF